MSAPSQKCTPSPSSTSPALYPSNNTNAPSHEFKEPQQPNIDQNNAFWETYVQEARKYDAELLEGWNETLSSLLLFAALFSAINTAFIIECQKGLQSDPVQTANNLLRLLVKHRNDSSDISEAELDPPWKADPNALRLNGIFFASLSFSLIASFGAILGKEMLSEYKVSGALNSLAERGQIRQLKFDALQKYRFRVLMHLLPTLLQISLALFLVGIIDFLWQMKVGVAMVMFVPVVVGFVAYIISLFIAIRHPHSPFQTSVSNAVRSLFSTFGRFVSSTSKYTRNAASNLRGSNWRNNSMKALLRGEIQLFTFHWNEVVPRSRMAGLHLLEVARRFFSHGKGKEKEDEVKSACVSWLMEQAGDSKIQLRALEAVPLLPPNNFLPHFKRKIILERFTALYNCNLSRRPGQVKFRPDEEQTRAAIVAGTALYHISKSRDEDDMSFSQILKLEGDADVFDIVETPDRFHELDPLLITVIHCVQSQLGVDPWDLDLLQQLLETCASSTTSIKPKSSILTLHQRTASQVSLATFNDTSVVALLLDSILYCASRRREDDLTKSNLSIHGPRFEKMIDLLPDILGQRQSVMLASHAAIVVSGIQWYKAADEACPPKLKKFEFNNITRERIRSAWFANDKSAQFYDNVAMAFGMVGDELSPATMKFYLALMGLVERLHPNSMSVTWKDVPAWSQWWSTTVQIIPGMLRVFQKVDGSKRLEIAKTALRIIAQLLPDDWMEGAYLQQLGPIAQLRHISPHDSESGVRIKSLICTFLNEPTLQQCKTTREAAAEVIGWIMIMDEHRKEPGLPSAIVDPTGIYQHSKSVPSFLSSVLVDQTADEILRLFLQHRFNHLLNLPAAQNGSISIIQLEAFVLSLTHLHEFPHFLNPSSEDEEPPQTTKCVRDFMDRIADGSRERIWPASFVSAGIIAPQTNTTSPYRTVLKLKPDDDKLFMDDDTRFLWMGSAITIVWKAIVKTANVSSNHMSTIFSNDAISIVLNSYDSALKADIPVDFRLYDDYLDAAQTTQNLSSQLQQQVEDTRVSLTSALAGDWPSLVFDRIKKNQTSP
ncbi:hypothetical protein FRC03_012650 [Tulasnella sp. 419]|nr:hypothetical protein FRC03_012650 [Tulasnella sp. 419]